MNYTFGFVFEQTLGHVTHSKNLMVNIRKDPSVNMVSAPINYDVAGLAAQIPIYKSNWTVRAGLRARRAVAKMQAKQPIDTLFVHTQVPAVLMKNWLKRIPTVVSLDATPLQYDQLGEHYNHSAGGMRMERLKWKANCACFRDAAQLVTWSQWAKQGLVDDYLVAPEKVSVIPPGVNLDEWAKRGEEPEGDKAIRILFVGADLKRKGGQDLLEAFRAIRETYATASNAPMPELHLVTRTPLADETGVTVYNNMEPNSPELKQLFYQSHIFCLPTYGDCLPMVLAEASAVGLPLISTNVAAIPEVVQEGHTGILIRPGDDNALAAALRALINDATLRRRLGANAAALAQRDHSGEKNAIRLLDIMKTLSHERHSKEARVTRSLNWM